MVEFGPSKYHVLVRTSQLGEPFFGYCCLCGMVNLPEEATSLTCLNPLRLTLNDAVDRELPQLG